MVAELRVRCVKCGRPIPVDADVCPFRNCGAQQPAVLKAKIKDSDLDSMPDEWELKYELNPNADDALQDADQKSRSVSHYLGGGPRQNLGGGLLAFLGGDGSENWESRMLHGLQILRYPPKWER